MKNKILIIDDNPTDVKILSRLLGVKDYELIVAYEGLDGFEKAKRENPDLIFLDLTMPKMDGHMVCKLLKSDKKCQRTPIIMLTGSLDAEDKEWGFKTGADAYLQKPIQQNELFETLKKLLENKKDQCNS